MNKADEPIWTDAEHRAWGDKMFHNGFCLALSICSLGLAVIAIVMAFK